MLLRRVLAALGRFGVYVIAFVIGLGAVSAWFKSNFLAPISPGSTEFVQFEVPKGANLQTVAEELEKQHLVRKAFSISLQRFVQSDPERLNNIKWGEYSLSPGMTPKKILETIVNGKLVEHPVTIPEGVNLSDVAQIIAKTGLTTVDEVKSAMASRSLLLEMEIPALSAEGYLAPETYNFSRPVTADQIVGRIIQEGSKRRDDGLRGWKDRAKELGFTPYQMMILASIVEKETAKPEERGTIASVFHNRLRIGMPLQSDPTVIYGISNFNGNLTKDDLKNPGPYNTYLNTGLPPTPICNPGLDSLRAVLYPDDTDYLYFVAKGDGSHHFSATYKEHQAAVNTYQKAN